MLCAPSQKNRKCMHAMARSLLPSCVPFPPGFPPSPCRINSHPISLSYPMGTIRAAILLSVANKTDRNQNLSSQPSPKNRASQTLQRVLGPPVDKTSIPLYVEKETLVNAGRLK